MLPSSRLQSIRQHDRDAHTSTRAISKNRKRSLEGPWVRRRARAWSWQKLEREEVKKTMLARHDSKDSHHEQSVTDRVVLTVL
jgi:hypothetical protein